MEPQVKNLIWYLIFPLLLLVAAVYLALPLARPDFLLHASFYSSDTALVRTYLGRQVLINGGSSDAVLADLGSDMPFFDHSLDLVIATSLDANHLSGLIDVIKRFQVEKVLLPAPLGASPVEKEFSDLIDQRHIQKIYAYEGQRIWLDPATVLDVYWPAVQAGTDPSPTIIARLTFGSTKILFAGNADPTMLQQLSQQFDLHSDLLQIEAKDLTAAATSGFVQVVSAKYVINDQTETARFVSDGSSLDKK